MSTSWQPLSHQFSSFSRLEAGSCAPQTLPTGWSTILRTIGGSSCSQYLLVWVDPILWWSKTKRSQTIHPTYRESVEDDTGRDGWVLVSLVHMIWRQTDSRQTADRTGQVVLFGCHSYPPSVSIYIYICRYIMHNIPKS